MVVVLSKCVGVGQWNEMGSACTLSEAPYLSDLNVSSLATVSSVHGLFISPSTHFTKC